MTMLMLMLSMLMLVQAIPPDSLIALAALAFLLGGIAAVWAWMARGSE